MKLNWSIIHKKQVKSQVFRMAKESILTCEPSQIIWLTETLSLLFVQITPKCSPI